jgi:enoyl-CoA hydratase/carnithine racemase
MSAVPKNQEPVLLREDRDGIATLTLNRPQQMNLLTMEMLDALQDALASIAKNEDIRVVVLAAAGKGFCAGHDLKEIRELREQMSIQGLPQPVIAKVQGAAAAAGCQLVAQCDLAVAVDSAKFVTSGVTWGFFCSTPGVAIGRNLHRKHAMEMLLTGEPISAARALEWGLVNRVVPADRLDAEVLQLAGTIAAKPPSTVTSGKRAFYVQMGMDATRAYELAGEVIASSFAHAEGKAGMEAFIGKRPPPGGRK